MRKSSEAFWQVRNDWLIQMINWNSEGATRNCLELMLQTAVNEIGCSEKLTKGARVTRHVITPCMVMNMQANHLFHTTYRSKSLAISYFNSRKEQVLRFARLPLASRCPAFCLGADGTYNS